MQASAIDKLPSKKIPFTEFAGLGKGGRERWAIILYVKTNFECVVGRRGFNTYRITDATMPFRPQAIAKRLPDALSRGSALVAEGFERRGSSGAMVDSPLCPDSRLPSPESRLPTVPHSQVLLTSCHARGRCMQPVFYG